MSFKFDSLILEKICMMMSSGKRKAIDQWNTHLRKYVLY